MVKKNLGFFITISIFVIIFIVGLVMLVLVNLDENKLSKSIKSGRSALSTLHNFEPSLNEANKFEAEKNVAHLKQVYERKKRLLEVKNPILTETDDNRFLASVVSHIQTLTNLCNEVSDENKDPIKLPDEFGFGFDLYYKGGTFTEEMKPLVPVLDKQRQLLEYLARQIINVRPDGIQSIKRQYVEYVEGANKSGPSTTTDKYEIPTNISLEKPNEVETLAFEVSFYGHTQSLRAFLNKLLEEEYPFIIRDIKVKTAQKKDIEKTFVKKVEKPKPKSSAKPEDAFASLFGIQPSSNQSSKEETKQVVEEKKPQREPIIKEDVSTFTIVLEYVDFIYDVEKEVTQNVDPKNG
jgi:hypothetical protein